MSEPVLASYEDLEARMGTSPDTTRALAALSDASALIHLVSNYRWIDEDGDLVADVPGAVLAICCSAARRVLENPTQLSNETETIANYSQSQTYAVASNDVYLTKSELVRIRQASGASGISTVSTTRGDLETKEVYPYNRVWSSVPDVEEG